MLNAFAILIFEQVRFEGSQFVQTTGESQHSHKKNVKLNVRPTTPILDIDDAQHDVIELLENSPQMDMDSQAVKQAEVSSSKANAVPQNVVCNYR